MPESADLYEILQVHPSAHPEVIQAAYRRLAQLYHPDRNAYPDAEERMAEINHAYDILGDPVRRDAYDRERGGTGQSGNGAVAEVIRAKSFELVNDAGQTRAGLSVDQDGDPVLFMLDANGKERFQVVQMESGAPLLIMCDQHNNARIIIGQSDSGSSALRISDRHDDTLLWLGESDDGTPMLYTADQNGNRRFALEMTRNGAPVLYMSDQNGRQRFELELSDTGAPHWTMRDQKGDPKIWAVIEDNGKLELGKDSFW